MRVTPRIVVGIVAAALAGAGGAMGEDRGPAGASRRDLHSYGNPDQVRVRAIDLDLRVDFDRKVLDGEAVLTVEREAAGRGRARLVLDTRDLTVRSVAAGSGSEMAEAPFTLGKADPILGAPLSVELPEGASRVRVSYTTAPGASALQWVAPAGTAGGKKPFLFTQSQAIHARSWVPCQDSPGVRVTYAATIRVPEGLVAVMAADRKEEGQAEGDEGRRTRSYRFEMPQPIPSYLIALAVGDLEFKSLGRRTGVWAEPAVVGKAAYEFADTEAMVEVAEKRFGPYRWGRYDILVLPPSFPFGGMENPKLTFATPTVLAGDRSLVALVAHELAHSWSGNLVTNATWRDFWLNEGFTTYIERRIVEDLYGPDRAAMERALGLADLRDELSKLGPGDEVLHVDLKGRDPDEGMTRIPYEKGALFLTLLEQTFGRERFDPFLKGYFDRFAFKSITTADFEDYLRTHLFQTKPGQADPIDLHLWLHGAGLPPDAPRPRAERFDEVDRQARRWLDGAVATKDLPAKEWSTFEWLRFLQDLPHGLGAKRMVELDEAFGLTRRGNTEIAAQWLQMAIRNGYRPADARLEEFLTTIGRRKFLVPLYTELAKTPEGKARARAIYAKARPSYHPIAVESIDKLLGRP
jgi:leukotriene-A4 hydrolase